jgi:enoyl-CoA hydratase
MMSISLEESLERLALTTLTGSVVSSGVILLLLNRPERLNAINSLMMKELADFWGEVSTNDMVRVVILSGVGDKSFCAGADLKERKGLSEEKWTQQHSQLQTAMRLMTTCSKPILAAVNGYAFGGGLELVLACDFAYASDNAMFALPEVQLGIMPGAMGTQLLPRAVGMRFAKEMIFTGDSLTAQQAYSRGIVSAVVPQDDLLDTTIDKAIQISKNAPLSVMAAKRAVNYAAAKGLSAGYDFEIKQYNQLLSSEDRVEGINAFNEKRTANFKGE